MKLNYILQIIKKISFILFIYSLIQLIPTMFNNNIIGILFLIMSIIYILNEAFVFLVKDKKINNNTLKNILNIILNIYIILIAYRYTNSVDNIIYTLNNQYFTVNYIIAIIGMLGVIFNTLTMTTNE